MLAALLALPAAARAATPGTRLPPGPPFDPTAKTPHRISLAFDTAPARDILTLLSGGAEAPAALRHLRASGSVRAAVRSENVSAEDFFGRLVAAASGTPDPLLASYKGRSAYFAAVLDQIDKDGPGLDATVASRIAQLLPESPAVDARLVVVPFFGVSGYGEVTPVREEGGITFVAELPRLTGDALAAPQPREALLKIIRVVASEGWRVLFNETFRKPPAWPAAPGNAADFDTFLALTVSEGPATVFLFADEFFPLDPFLGEPIERAFRRWNRAAEMLLDPVTKEKDRRDLLAGAMKGDFWARYAAIVGAQMTDLLLRQAGREAYLRALAAGPRAVAAPLREHGQGVEAPRLLEGRPEGARRKRSPELSDGEEGERRDGRQVGRVLRPLAELHVRKEPVRVPVGPDDLDRVAADGDGRHRLKRFAGQRLFWKLREPAEEVPLPGAPRAGAEAADRRERQVALCPVAPDDRELLAQHLQRLRHERHAAIVAPIPRGSRRYFAAGRW